MPNPNSTRQEWEQLYHNLSANQPNLQRDLPSVPPKMTPLVNDPNCEEHCTRHEIDRILTCGACAAQPYHVVLHQWPWSEGHYWHKIEPRNGAPEYTGSCPGCGGSI